MNKLKRSSMIIIPLIVIMLSIAIITTVTLGWYTNTNRIGKIDANTKNSGFSYKINGVKPVTDEYYISNLAFFDIDSLYEGKHFDDMVYEIELDIENITNSPLEYSIVFEGEKFKVGTPTKSLSYVACVMSPVRLGYTKETQAEFDSTKTYYTYDTSNNKYTEYTQNSFPSDKDIYYFNPDYVPFVYELTSDKIVTSNKTYYDENNQLMVTRGNNISLESSLLEKTESDDQKFYEVDYDPASSWNSSGTYYTQINSETGKFYLEATGVTEQNYTNYYVKGNTLSETSDTLFQNETYYIIKNEEYIELETITPGTQITSSMKYYEKGKKVNSLINSSLRPDVNYTPNYGTTDSFMAEYTGGVLAAKSDDPNAQVGSIEQRVYLYVFGVQEIDSAINSDFIELAHKFKIYINTTTNSSWSVTEQSTTNS